MTVFHRRSKLVEKISKSDSGRFARYSGNMLYEVSRKGSFDNKTLPHHLNPGTLARKGFHYGEGINFLPVWVQHQ